MSAYEDVNSSDFEFESPTYMKANKHAGQASLDRIIEAAEQDRYTTKKTAKQWEYGHGAPDTMYRHNL